MSLNTDRTRQQQQSERDSLRNLQKHFSQSDHHTDQYSSRKLTRREVIRTDPDNRRAHGILAKECDQQGRFSASRLRQNDVQVTNTMKKETILN